MATEQRDANCNARAALARSPLRRWAWVAWALACWPATSHADTWDAQGRDCVKAFGAAAQADEKQLVTCADSFNAEAKLHLISASDRATIEKGLRHLYDNGSDRASRIAREGLFRLEVRLPARGSRPDTPAGAPAAQASRNRYDPPEAREPDRKDAEALAKGGVKLLLKKKYAAGAEQLEKALAKDPRSEFALYNLACAEANLPDRKAKALTHLQYLADLGTEQSLERLIKARSDADFVPLREDTDFKRITGYMRIQVINTIGRPGEPALENIEKLLDKLGHKSRDTADVDKPQNEPVILFKPHTKAQVSLLAELLNHPRTRLDPLDPGSKYDLVIRWGAKVETVDGKTKVESFGPDTVDESLEGARRKQNKVLAQPEAAINKVNKVITTPERAYGQVESMGKRVEGTVDKATGTLEKMKDLGDKLDSL